MALVGLLLARLRSPGMLWVYLNVFSAAGLFSLILTMIRYRLPAMPWVILLASYSIWTAWERFLAPRLLSRAHSGA